MKKLIPYMISYLIVATCTSVYPRIYSHFARYPPTVYNNAIAIVLNPGMTHDEMVVKLQQVGLSEAQAQSMPKTPSHLPVLVLHYIFDAVMFSAFVGLVILFQRMFKTEVPTHDHVA